MKIKGMVAVNAPIISLDPFSDEFLSDPYPFHEELRETGSVFYLEKYGVFGVARYADVKAILADHENYCSRRGVGLVDFEKEKPWREPSLLLETDPPVHDKTRHIVSSVLNIRELRRLQPSWKEKAVALIASLVEKRTFDAVKDLGEVYPLSVFPDAIGIRKEGREHLLPYGALAFNAFGPDNWIRREALSDAQSTLEWIAGSCRRENLALNGFGRDVFHYVDKGEISESEGERLVRSFLTAGLDTTVNGISAMTATLAMHPEQFEILRHNRDLIRHAFEEVLRWISPAQTFFRTTAQNTVIAGVHLPEGSKVLLFLGAANRDPRQWKNADKFDVRRRPIGHIGFGHGIHNCVGQMVARMEAELVLEAMVDQLEHIEQAGEPIYRLNNTLRSISSAPVKIIPVKDSKLEPMVVDGFR